MADDRVVESRVYRHLPGLDCGECGFQKCAEFAKELVFGSKEVYDCPHIKDDEAQAVVLILDEHYK